MELMNRDCSMLPRDFASTSESVFKQDPRLISAINKLYGRNEKDDSNSEIVLPERKLNFEEVQKMLNKSSKDTEKAPSTYLQERSNIRKELIKNIEKILEKLNSSAENGDTPILLLRNQRLWSNCVYDLNRVTLKAFADAKKTTLSYSNREDKTRFNAVVFVLTKVHELLLKNLSVTRRELFYQNVTRLRNQANLDIAVRDVCCLLQTPPWNLGIMATAKGLIAGHIQLQLRDGSYVDCFGAGGTLIPQDVNGIKEFRSTAKYILVVEKDAIFQKLLDEGALVRLGPVIILTGKGYPDVCTRQLLCRLVNELRLKALALVDADPHGYEIFLTYKYGSLAQSHLSQSLACSSLQLLGARHGDVMTLAEKEARLKLTALDKKKIVSLLKRPYLDTAVGFNIKKDLEEMLASGVKAEIEALSPTAAALCDFYLPSKIMQGKYLG
ncbi:meiotic recombination protein SPO11 isoform X1 [Papilio machaon]|uniref:meiotic recombination protein SPO11 isoform X1 n=1 Tax=Papilio machaon TaxID=76193 RepID=UPI001E666121|nr:meiotic recombination protein SPO11 isoform X1 [Papilio machaon]